MDSMKSENATKPASVRAKRSSVNPNHLQPGFGPPQPKYPNPADQESAEPGYRNVDYGQEGHFHGREEFVKRIFATHRAIPKLTKSEHNNHGGYNYASIDDYYEHIASVAAENGLLWWLNETSAPGLYNYEDKSGGYKQVVMCTYEVNLMTDDGQTWERFRTINVRGPYGGFQSTGIAEAYAEKQFLRELFKVRTGEPDADGFDKEGNNVQGDIRKSTGAVLGKSGLGDDPFNGL